MFFSVIDLLALVDSAYFSGGNSFNFVAADGGVEGGF